MSTKKRKTVRTYHKKCLYCGMPFVSHRKHSKTCSVSCRTGLSKLKKEMREIMRTWDDITETDIDEFVNDDANIRDYVEGLFTDEEKRNRAKVQAQVDKLNRLAYDEPEKYESMTEDEVYAYLNAKD